MGTETFWQEFKGLVATLNSKHRQMRLLDDQTFLLSLLVGAIIVTVQVFLALSSSSSRYLMSTSTERLEQHPMCGVTTGGKEECYFDCLATPSNISINGYQYYVATKPSCLQDCFSENEASPSYCLHSLLKDILSKGMCLTDTYLTYTLSDQCKVSDKEIIKGTCSDQTERLLVTDECFRNAYEQPLLIQNSVFMIIANSCSSKVSKALRRKLQSIPKFPGPSTQARLNPVTNIGQGFKTKIEYENTKNRYSWICSLRTHGINPEHLCSVTLLAKPPQPTILIGPAHCSLICRDRGHRVSSCCCITSGVESCRSDLAKCGEDARVSELLPEEVNIVCGEWELGAVPRTVSREKYNVILPVEEIVVHENYDFKKGPINGNDIAVFKVKDTQLANADSERIYPACLPDPKSKRSSFGFQSGWAPPPQYYYVEKFWPFFIQHYGDLSKQFHYKMEINDQCEDPKSIKVYGKQLKYPSNTSYPAGTVCAKDFLRHCYTTGDSGSPLMVRDSKVASQFHIEGIQSFSKGCEFNKLSYDEYLKDFTFFGVNQENPSVFTKVFCYLPWIAKQFKLSYQHENEVLADKSCSFGTGDPEDDQKQICRESIGYLNSEERECIFPYYYEGKLQNECFLFSTNADFIIPTFRCPTWNIVNKINGTNSYTFSDLILVEYCVNKDGELDPSIKSCPISERIPPLVPCKNNCPGVRGVGIIGGGALVATAVVVGGASSLLPALGLTGLGMLGLGGGGALVARAGCMGPLFCTTLPGDCCLVVQASSGLVCPISC